MKPDFNDFVEHQGMLYGFDGAIFACVDMATGKRQWMKGRYGNGQVLLLCDAGQMLITSEAGELVLLKADPFLDGGSCQISSDRRQDLESLCGRWQPGLHSQRE